MNQVRKTAYKLLIIPNYGAGMKAWSEAGFFRVTIKLLQELSRLYSEIWIFTYDLPHELVKFSKLIPANVKFLARPRWLPKLLHSLITPILKFHHLREVKLIRTTQFWGSWTALLFKFLLRGKFLLRQGFQFSKFVKDRRWLRLIATVYEKLAYRIADRIIVTTDEDCKYIRWRYKIDPLKITVIPNWVDTSIFRPMNGVKKENKRIIFVGRLEKQKNVLALVRAVKLIPDAKLYIFGLGSLEEEIRKETRGFDNIRLMGVVPHERLPYELNRSEIFILPSLYEGHPKALLEAMACGLPVIGSRVEGIKGLIEDGVNGLLCEPTPEDIRRKIVQLLSDRNLRERLGKNAREFVV